MQTTDQPTATRREFIQSTALLAGGLVLGIRLSGAEERQGGAHPAAARDPAGFVRIAPDETITLVVPCVEMGQGAHTALPMILMEELEGDWSRLRVEDAPADPAYDNPMIRSQMTVGSFAVRGWYEELRRVGAAAREMLIRAAAAEWGVPAAECTAKNGVITHGPSGRRTTYGKVAERAAKLEVPAAPRLKSPEEFRFIGRPTRRLDTAFKVDGRAKFGIDVMLPDMLFAAVRTCPTLGGKLRSFDDSAARRMPGFVATVPLADGVIVVARSWWQARQALEKVSVEYDRGRLATLDSAGVSAILRRGLEEEGQVARDDGDARAALARASTIVEADYEVPYLAHACMEPMNCTARVTADGCEIWVSTQAPQRCQQVAAKTLGIPAGKVVVHGMYLGGGFGRRGEADFVEQAVIAARAVKRPVKLVWTREEDIQHDYYRPAAAIRFRAAVDGRGRVVALESRVVTASVPDLPRPMHTFYTQGITDTGYAIPDFRVTAVNKDIGVRFGFWRSVNHSHNPFMLESFIDELAHRAGQDPWHYRRSLLVGHEPGRRQLGVLDLAAEKAGWREPPPAGRFRGIAALFAYGSWIANVVELSVAQNDIRVHRVVCAIDCGIAVNPDTIAAQLEGGMVYGLTAALRGEITLREGAVVQSNFHDYPLLTIREMPAVEVHVVKSDEPPGGVGEPGTAPIAPALANALFAATGRRVRSLPLTRHGFTHA